MVQRFNMFNMFRGKCRRRKTKREWTLYQTYIVCCWIWPWRPGCYYMVYCNTEADSRSCLYLYIIPCEFVLRFFLVNHNFIPQIVKKASNKHIGNYTIVSDYKLPLILFSPGAVVKADCFESRRSRVRTPLWSSSFKETKCSFPAHS